MIAVGNNGIAPGTKIYSTNSMEWVRYYLTWFTENNVNIFNASYALVYTTLEGTYSSDSRIIDNYSDRQYILPVVASGNYDKKMNHYVSSPSTGFNVISVGNSDDSTEYLYEDSCYEERDGYTASKPTLVAPGNVSTNANTDGGTGTSFASPQVAGCIALLMEEFPSLTRNLDACIAIAAASASPMSEDYNIEKDENHYDGSGFHNQIGTGLLNYEKMREAAANWSGCFASSVGELSSGIEIEAKEGQRIRAAGAWMANGSDEDNFDDYDLELYKKGYNGNLELVAYINDDGNNVEFIDFEVKTSGTYFLAARARSLVRYVGAALTYVLIDADVGGSTSGATNVDETDATHFEIETDAYSSFDSTYNSEEETDTIYDSNGKGIVLNRLRSRYTNDGQFVLSAKSNDANEAYAEYLFDGYAVYDIHYEFGLWSASENLILNSSIDLYGLIEDEWELIRHFSAKEMTTDPDNLGYYIDTLDKPAEGLRFHVTTNKTNNSNNVGRVVIGEIGGNMHEHSYDTYESVSNASQHLCSCDCGYSKYASHVFGSVVIKAGKEYSVCDDCGYMEDRTRTPGYTYD